MAAVQTALALAATCLSPTPPAAQAPAQIPMANPAMTKLTAFGWPRWPPLPTRHNVLHHVRAERAARMGGYQLLYPNTLMFSTATFMTRHLDLLEWRSKHLSVLAQTIPDADMCRFGGIDTLDRRY